MSEREEDEVAKLEAEVRELEAEVAALGALAKPETLGRADEEDSAAPQATARSEKAAEEWRSVGTMALVAGLTAWTLMLVVSFGWFVLLPAYAAAVAAIVWGIQSLRGRSGVAAAAAKGVAIGGLVLGIVHLGAFLVLPLLFFLLCCSCSSGGCGDCGSGSGSSSGGGCACGTDAGCCEGGCDLGCGDCGSGCDSGCSCAGVAARTPRIDGRGGFARFAGAHLAHHPDTPAFVEDVYRIAGARLCVGCFTTFPVFLAALGLLSATAPAMQALVVAGVGMALSGAQVVSSLGRARKRWQKIVVKSLLGTGLALVLHGILSSSLGADAQAGVLLATLTLAMLSTIPRTLRMRSIVAA